MARHLVTRLHRQRLCCAGRGCHASMCRKDTLRKKHCNQHQPAQPHGFALRHFHYLVSVRKGITCLVRKLYLIWFQNGNVKLHQHCRNLYLFSSASSATILFSISTKVSTGCPPLIIYLSSMIKVGTEVMPMAWYLASSSRTSVAN
jgi:hypothetical protein